jgi:hypothetical protein
MTINQYQEDIFSEWKKQRFIVVESAIAHDNAVSHLIVLTDIYFWTDHADALDAWCADHPGAVQMGMTVGFDNQELLLMFILRWS